MAQALIKVNGSDGSKVSVPCGVAVLLANHDNGGETDYAWSLTVPEGSSASLSSPTSPTPQFTPDIEGTYLIRLSVNSGAYTDSAIAGVAHVLSATRVPAYEETTEANTDATVTADDGWNSAMSPLLRLTQDHITGPVRFVAAAASSAVTPGTIVYASGKLTIKAGLPGEQSIFVVSPAYASSADNIHADLYYVAGFVSGYSAGTNALVWLIASGQYPPQIISGIGTGFQPVYVSNAAVPSATPGSNARIVGYQVTKSGGLSYGVWQSIALAHDTDPASAPADQPFLVLGNYNNALLTSAVRIDNLVDTAAPIPFKMVKANNGTAKDLIELRFSQTAATQDGDGIAIPLYMNNGAGTPVKVGTLNFVLVDKTPGATIFEMSFPTLSGAIAGSEIALRNGSLYMRNVTGTREVVTEGMVACNLRVGTNTAGKLYLTTDAVDHWHVDEVTGNIVAEGSEEIIVATPPSTLGSLTPRGYVDSLPKYLYFAGDGLTGGDGIWSSGDTLFLRQGSTGGTATAIMPIGVGVSNIIPAGAKITKITVVPIVNTLGNTGASVTFRLLLNNTTPVLGADVVIDHTTPTGAEYSTTQNTTLTAGEFFALIGISSVASDAGKLFCAVRVDYVTP